MDLSYHSVVIFVDDIEISKQFYMSVLNQELEYDFGRNVAFKSGISLWEIIEGHVIRNTGGHVDTGSTKSYELYFETNNIQQVQLDVAKHRLSILHDLIEEPWGQRTIRFYDPDNNLIEVGETMEAFIVRFSESGMTEEEVSERTTVPVEIVREILQKL